MAAIMISQVQKAILARGFMGRPLLVATALAWHVSGFLGGLFCKGLLERQLPGTEQVKAGLRHAVEAAAEKCATTVIQQCVAKADCEPSEPSKPQKDRSREPGHSGSWRAQASLVVAVSLANWLIGFLIRLCLGLHLCRRREQVEDSSEEQSPTSPQERQELAHRQLALIRRRRHGFS